MKIPRISLALKAWRELGPKQLGLYALYQLGLWTGYYRYESIISSRRLQGFVDHRSESTHPLLELPEPAKVITVIGQDELSSLIAEADEIVEGRVRLFGGQPVPLDLTLPPNLPHWSKSENISTVYRQPSTHKDIKFIWEPARFGWAFTLGRAYHLTDDERYAEAFWGYFETFLEANPVNMGPNWSSGQEVALRLIAFTFAAQIFENSTQSTSDRKSKITQSIIEHATRIPPTLFYARAQNNNHLLSEAAGLITASLALPNHPQAKRWSKLGWKWFNWGLEHQIAGDGSYIQQSTNYHRLMLQLSLWVYQVSATTDQENLSLIPATWNLLLGNATRWLLALTDPNTSCVPNLGPNDGSYILPLTILPFRDYRPVLQAASQAFLGEPAFEAGIWDEMALWVKIENSRGNMQPPTSNLQQPILPAVIKSSNSWAYLRAAQLLGRPGHADQLHLDLWWRGLNIAQDAGTYLYNADAPWNNALTHTAVHNTVMIDSQEQMARAGRFLYLDKALAEMVDYEHSEDLSWQKIIARHSGYLRLGIIHNRSVTSCDDGSWVILDYLQPTDDQYIRMFHTVRLHWLLPDWAYELSAVECGLQNLEGGIRILSPYGFVSLRVQLHSETSLQSETCDLQLIRAGESIYGHDQISPTWGWVSPTYGIKVPALSFSVSVVGQLPMTLISEWDFPEAK